MKNLIKKLCPFSLSLLSLSAPLFAQADVEMKVSKLESQMRDASTSNARGTYGAKLADASPNIDGYGFYVSADAIAYKFYEDNNTYAIDYQTPSDQEPQSKVLTHRSNLKWAWGFKTGLGYYAEHDFWQTGFEFTYLKTQTGETANAATNRYLQIPQNSMPGILSDLGAEFTSAHDSWKLSFYNLDWRLGKDFFVSKYLSLLPQIGIKSSWIYQDRTTTWSEPTGPSAPLPLGGTLSKAESAVTDTFVGVGPKVDLLAKFFLGKNFSVLGGFDLALLYATNKTTLNGQLIPSSDPQIVYETQKFQDHGRKYAISPYMGLNIGLGYDTNFNEDSFNLGVYVAYELGYYNKASRIFAYDDFTYRDVSFQGVDVKFVFAF